MTRPLLVLLAIGLFWAHVHAQEISAWGQTFDCGVDWFRPCLRRPIKTDLTEEKEEKKPADGRSAVLSLLGGRDAGNVPAPVRNVLENPTSATAREYVKWIREGNERLTEAHELIAEAEREMGPPQGKFGEAVRKKEEAEKRGVVGLYYFFSPRDPSSRHDVEVLNKMYREEQIGAVGIPVRATNDEVVSWLKLVNPLFPVRRGEGEIKLMNPKGTPELYLALPLEKKIFKVGQNISEEAIKQALANAVAYIAKERFGSASR